MYLRDVEYVLAVASCGSFSRAARQLYITQPGLSKYIQKLEAQLGTPLFVRRHGKISLTPFGAEFVIRAQMIHNICAELGRALAQRTG